MAFHNSPPAGLSVETRKGRRYLYTRVRVAGRLRGRYVAPVDAQTADAIVGWVRVDREGRRSALRQARERVAAVLAAGAAADARIDDLTRVVMVLGGFHLHRRSEWRRRRITEATDVFDDDDDDDDDDLDAPPPRPPHLPVVGDDAYTRAVFARAARGDRAVLPTVRAFLENPANRAAFGDVQAHARQALVGSVAGDHLVVAEAVAAELAEVEARFLADCGSEPSFAERVAAGRAAHAWVTAHHLEVLLTREKPGSPAHLAVEKVLGRADRRLQAALKGMAVLRRLRGPAVKVTEVNVGEARTVVVVG